MKFNNFLKSLMKKVWWWQPITLLLMISAFGIYYSNTADENQAPVSAIVESNQSELSGSEDVVEIAGAENPGEVETFSGEEEQDTAVAVQEVMGGDTAAQSAAVAGAINPTDLSVTEDGNYTSKEEVALYIHTYNKLPSNYITKKQAEEQGWSSSDGNLHEVLPGMSIGGSRFGNYEQKLPKKDGREYFECDIDYEGGYRNSKRLVYSNDGLVFYTEDHYESFEQLY